MNIFKQEFNMKKKSILIWSLSIAGFMLFYMAFFPSISQDGKALEELMASFPAEFLEAFGMGGGLSIASLMGYFTVTFTMIQLALAIQSANYGFSILSEEERELTADFLFSKPVSRTTIYLSKFFAAFLGLTITNIVLWLGSFIALEVFNGGQRYDFVNVFMLLSTVPLFQLFFLSVGMLISVLVKRIRNVLSFSMALAIGLYVINAVRGIIESEALGYITPYYYFEPGEILQRGEYDLPLLFIGIAVIVISLVGSYILYNRRNIHSL